MIQVIVNRQSNQWANHEVIENSVHQAIYHKKVHKNEMNFNQLKIFIHILLAIMIQYCFNLQKCIEITRKISAKTPIMEKRSKNILNVELNNLLFRLRIKLELFQFESIQMNTFISHAA